MEKKINHIIIKYSNIKEEDLNSLFQILNQKYLELRNFFNGFEPKEDIIFNIWDNYNDFKNMCISKYGHYREGTVGKANSNNIDILTYTERIKIEQRKNDPIEYYYMTFCHEMVHKFHIEYKGNNKGTWFAEGLACLLGSPRYECVPINYNAQDFINAKLSYKYYYSLVKFMIDNYPHNKILEYARNDELLISNTEEILDNYNKNIKTNNSKKNTI